MMISQGIISVVFVLVQYYFPVNGLCGPATAAGPVAFQTSVDGQVIRIILPVDTRVELACCAVGFTTITWTLNRVPLAAFNDSFTLLENNQVLLTPINPTTGNYSCIVANATSSIQNIFVVSVFHVVEACRLGTVGAVVAPSPPESNYRTSLGFTVQLTCKAIIYCGDPVLVNRVGWWKINPSTDDFSYALYSGAETDANSGDYVNVTWRYFTSPRPTLHVKSVLTIQNVDPDDLYVDKPFPPNCGKSNRSRCILPKSGAQFQCAILLEESGDPTQANYSLTTNVKLHPDFRLPGNEPCWPKIGSKKVPSRADLRKLNVRDGHAHSDSLGSHERSEPSAYASKVTRVRRAMSPAASVAAST